MKNSNNCPLFVQARSKFHRSLVERGVLVFDNGVASNCDKDNKPSCAIGGLIAKRLNAAAGERLRPQTAGSIFEELVCCFLKDTFPKLQNLRPGEWSILNLGNNNAIKVSSFVQYEHLAHVAKVMQADRQLAAMLGSDYVVAPDIVVSRSPCEDREINSVIKFVDETVAMRADIRKKCNPLEIMHASVSAKWTIRSDRAQNSRLEASNLMKNRKGRVPHIVVVTGEPLPSRLASLALGTGDIDCVYHVALQEMIESVREYGKEGREDLIELLDMMVTGKRLKDISDLPLDLAC